MKLSRAYVLPNGQNKNRRTKRNLDPNTRESVLNLGFFVYLLQDWLTNLLFLRQGSILDALIHGI